MHPLPRIAHVIHSGAVGGGPRIVLELATRAPGRHVVISAADGPLLADARAAGVETLTLPYAGEFSFSLSVPGLGSSLRSVDVVHLHGQYAGFYGAIASFLTRTPALYTAHFPSFVTDSTPATRVRNHVAELVPCRLARIVVACSETSRQEYLRRHLAAPDRIATIYNGVPDYTGSRPATELRRELDLDESPIVLGMGRFTDQKGFDLLIDAFAIVLQRLPTARLLLAGDGPLRPALEAQAERLGLLSKIRFLGFRRDSSDLLELANVVAVPSAYDVFPLVPLEAMRAGRVVVASDLPLFREAVCDGETGFLSSREPDCFASALVDVISNPELADRVGRQARREAARRFGVEVMVNRYAELYRKLAGVSR